MKKVMMGMMLLASGMFAMPRVEAGVRFGVRAPVAVVRPLCPGPGYVWTDGYWAPPAVVRVAPRFERRPVVEHRYEHFRR